MVRWGSIALVLMLAGCATARTNEFKEFAELGVQYEAAVGSVIEQATVANIDANSQELLNAREAGLSAGEAWRTQAVGALAAQNEAVLSTARDYAMIKRHTSLLSDYFTALGALAAFDGQSAIGTSAQQTVQSLQGLSPTLSQIPNLPEITGAAVPIIISNIQVQALEDELRRNGALINEQLILQERLLTFVSQSIARDREILAQRRILDELAVPFIEPTGALGADWRSARQTILTEQLSATDAASEAARLSRRLRIAFLGLWDGRINAADLQAHASDLSRLVTVAEIAIEGN